jgi:unsaturated rhamnogalacturonyl hydrolase
LESTHEFGKQKIEFEANTPGWRWARLAVWDIAGNGAFANPIRNAAGRKTVAVDQWHNREAEPHYAWEGTYPGGFSGLSHMLKGIGADLRTIKEPINARNLNGVDALIIVDPDTPKEAAKPNLIADTEIESLTAWVRNGGTLVLLGNDPGNAEFERMNALARRFGIEFEERKHADSKGVSKLTLPTPAGSWFTPGLKFYGVDLAPLKLSAGSAQTLLAEGGTPMMAAVKEGKGMVVALGDPWLYNEYLYTQDNRRIAEELFRKLLQ